DKCAWRPETENCSTGTFGTKERKPAESSELEEFVPDSTGTFGTNGRKGCEQA
ncbi:hypothetical protein KI387_019662, partial [Taxus chinensis]